MEKHILERYSRTLDGRVIIDITAEKVEDLYNNFDKSAPYIKQDLEQELVDYIVASVREVGKERFAIRFNFTSAVDDTLTSRVKTSIHKYFIYLKELEMRELKRMFRTSLILFSIGAAILTISVWVNQKVASDTSVIGSVFAEGLTVAAWVSLWEALATFLINWSPHRRQIKLYEHIADAPVLFDKVSSMVQETDNAFP